MATILFRNEAYSIQGAAFEVYRVMGAGFIESVYQECMENELRKSRIPFKSQPELRLSYKGITLKHIYRPDFLCYENINVELKAVKQILPEHRAQVINYIKAAKKRLGILVNFGFYPGAEIERFINGYE